MIKVTLKAQTEQIGERNSTTIDHIAFSGLNAGVCYMKDSFDVLNSQEFEVKFKRGLSTIQREHHSVAGHISMSVVIEGIPKICAMMLNNVGEYNTSEKSARYTVMKDLSERESKLYTKWHKVFIDLICEKYNCISPEVPNAKELAKEKKCRFTPLQVDKLAMENARYMISVFTPTTMTYTTSMRQFNYIIDWCRKFYAAEANTGNAFFTRVADYMNELADRLRDVLYVDGLRDTKNRSFNLINKHEPAFDEIKPFFGNTYQTTYKGTFAQLAQAQRHRTLDYVMYFDGNAKDFYVPPILEEHDDLVAEWLQDAESVADVVPQCTLVKIFETGTAENFILKAKERECGCAQLEIQEQTILTHTLYENSEHLTNELRGLFSMYGAKVRCGFKDYKCTSPCTWGIKAPSRLI